MTIDNHTREVIAVDGVLYRRAFADAVAKAVNNSPESVPASAGSADKVIAYFVAMCCEWSYQPRHLREWLKRTIGERSAAYRSIPDLFTKDSQ